jgi:hypothetical protein
MAAGSQTVGMTDLPRRETRAGAADFSDRPKCISLLRAG